MTLRDALAAALYSIALDSSRNPTLDLTDTAERVLADPAFRAALAEDMADAITDLGVYDIDADTFTFIGVSEKVAAAIVARMLDART